jgi:DnaJ-class molecular chaperone
MSNDLKCSYCFGTGQKVEMMPVKLGEKLPLYQPCPSCGGTGRPPKPTRVWRRRKPMRRRVQP